MVRAHGGYDEHTRPLEQMVDALVFVMVFNYVTVHDQNTSMIKYDMNGKYSEYLVIFKN